MHQHRQAAVKRRWLTAVPVLTLVAAGMSASGASVPAAAAVDSHPRYIPTEQDYYINYVEPKVEYASASQEAVGKGGAKSRPVRDLYGEELPGVGTLGSGDPGAVRLGVSFQLLFPGWQNQWAVVRVTAPPAG